MSDSAKVTRANRYDLLRLVFALLVLTGHSLQLPAPNIAPKVESVLIVLGEMAIRGFFIISGALVYGSLLRSETLGDYALKRVRRLYPAYAVAIIVPTLLALTLVPEARENLIGVAKYFLANIVFLNFLAPELPGVFQGHRFEEVNGALWTVKIEVMFYMFLPLIVWIGTKLGKYRHAYLVLIYIGAEVWRFTFEHYGMQYGSSLLLQISRQLPGQMSFIVMGMIAWEFRDFLREKWLAAGVTGLAGTIISLFPYMEWIQAVSLALLVTSIATAPGPKLNAAKFGDFSYGIYGWHFPVVQLVIAMGIYKQSYMLGFATASAITIVLAVLTWHFVEKPFLTENNWYRRKAKA